MKDTDISQSVILSSVVLLSLLLHICRSSTLAGWGELYGRTGYNYIFSVPYVLSDSRIVAALVTFLIGTRCFPE
ncbi:hypothetical protein PAMP_017968 [Pampus punctatissimus]